MKKKDFRWKQRLEAFQKSLKKLEEAVLYIKQEGFDDVEKKPINTLADLVQKGLIQNFEFSHELAWKLMKDYAEYQGFSELRDSRDASRQAFALKLVADGQVWMRMIESRNITSHRYDETMAKEVFGLILKGYYPAMQAFAEKMEKIAEKE